jgi:protein TonB
MRASSFDDAAAQRWERRRGPEDPILALSGEAHRDRTWAAGTLAIAAMAHAAAALAMPRLPLRAIAVERVLQVVDIDIPKPPPAPPRPEPSPHPSSQVPKATAHATKPAPRPLSQAAQVLTKKEDPDAPVDLTSTFVSGLGSEYAGAATGSGSLDAAPRAGPVAPPVRSHPPASPAADLSRHPSMAGASRWDCPFPPEADTAQIDSALVTIRVSVDVSGKMKDVSVLKDPGHGFGAEAVRCARTKTWNAALGHDGEPIEGSLVVNVHFER